MELDKSKIAKMIENKKEFYVDSIVGLGSEDYIFYRDGDTYILNDNWNEIGDDILEGQEKEVIEKFANPLLNTDISSIDFNQLKKIGDKAIYFNNQMDKFRNGSLKLILKESLVKIGEEAFDKNFVFDEITSTEGTEIVLGENSFNFKDKKMKGVSVYLSGNWTKENLESLLDAFEPDNVGNKVYMDAGKFSTEVRYKIDEVPEALKSYANSDLIKAVVEASKENLEKVVKEAKAKKKAKVTEDASFARKDMDDTDKEEKDNIKSWDKIDKEGENTNKDAIIEKMIKMFAEENIFAKINLDADKLELENGKIVITDGSIDPEKGVQFIGKTTEIMKKICNTEFNGKKLRNNKMNKDRAKDAARIKVIEALVGKTIEGGDMKVLDVLECKFVLNRDQLQERFPGENIDMGSSVIAMDAVVDKESLSNLIGRLDDVKKENEGKAEVEISEDLYKEIVQKLQVIGKQFKHVNKDIYNSCKEAYEGLKRKKS